METNKVTITLLLAILAGCGRQPGPREINIRVDPRMELLAVVQSLGDYGKRTGEITRYDFEYKREVKEHFGAFQDHRAIKKFEEMSRQGFSFDAPPAALLYLGNPPKLKQQRPFSDYVIRRAQGEDHLEELAQALRDFATLSKFMGFFKAHQGFYDQITADVKSLVLGKNYIMTLENYFGVRQHSYNIILVPLFTGGYGARIKLKDKTHDIYCLCGPQAVTDGRLSFGTAGGFKHLALHEFGHSFVNPVTEAYRERVARYDTLYTPLETRMKQQAYGNWEICLNEHLIRAVSGRLLLAQKGREAVKEMLTMEQNRGFYYIEPLFEQLEHYESQRLKYPTYRDFFPELLTVLEELATGAIQIELPSRRFNGTINSVTLDQKNVVLVMPTRERNQALQKRLHAFVKKMHKRAWAMAPLLTDRQALKKDLAGNSLVCYGTLQGHAWLAKHIKDLPVKIRKDRIIADKVYWGRNLRFITAWPHPRDPEKGIVIYTAHRSADIININSVYHGPTDWVIARGTKVLQAGFYEKGEGTWKFKKGTAKGAKRRE